MLHIVEDITNKFQTCATLMSDPHFLRHHSPLVASAFTTAFNSIEQLQTLIPPKPEKQCECGAQTLVDSSIINTGIKQLVSLALKKQLEPLIKPLPRIVHKDFKNFAQAPHADTDENLVEREIKETNCMASMVLLYYYLQWHALLILINSKVKGTLDRMEDEKLLETLAKLPKGSDMLEYRFIGKAFPQATGDGSAQRKAAHEGLEALHTLAPYMTNNAAERTDQFRNRKTKLVTLYRRAIEKIIGQPQPNSQFAAGDDLEHVLAEIRTEFSYKGTLLFGGVFSACHVNDGTQKWEDMYKKLSSQTQDANGKTAVYQFFLKKVLSHPPYAADPATFNANAVPLCIHDYNSSSLMVDIVKSASQLALLLTAIKNKQVADIPTRMFQLCSQFFAGDPKLEFALNADDCRSDGFQHLLFKDFIAEAHTSFRVNNGTLPYDGTTHAPNKFTVDEFPAYYSTASPVNLHNANHVYLALPGLEIDPDDTPFFKRIQKRASGLDLSENTVTETITPLIRNSLYTQYGIASVLALIERTKNLPTLELAGEYACPAQELFQTIPTAAEYDQKQLKRSDITSLLQRELDAYQQHLRKYAIQRPKLMPGISWPVAYNDGTNPQNNRDAAFDLVRHIPRQFLGTQRELNEEVHHIGTLLVRP
jgi:hypothetical protein